MKLGVIALLSKLGPTGRKALFGGTPVSFPDARSSRASTPLRASRDSPADPTPMGRILWLNLQSSGHSRNAAMRKLAILVSAVASSFCIALAQTPERPLTSLPYTPGLDVNAMDKSAEPCVDFYQYTCGGWMEKNPIPSGPPDRR